MSSKASLLQPSPAGRGSQDPESASKQPASHAGLTFCALRNEPGDLAALQDCLERNGDRRRSLEALRWLFVDNPGRGRLWVEVAWAPAQERIAAIYASLPLPLRLGERTVSFAQSLDTLTDTDYRGRGLFTRLAARVYERAAREGCAGVYGFPNGNSAGGFFSKLGWAQLDPVPLLVRPLRPRYFARRSRWFQSHLTTLLDRLPNPSLPGARLPLPPGLQLCEIQRFDERAGDLWREMACGALGVERDAGYLNWRLRDKPGESYRTRALHRPDGRLEALCSFCLKSKHGGKVAYIMELLQRPGAAYAGAALLSHAVAELAAQGADAVLALAFAHSPNRASFRLNAFMALPERLRPIELHFGARELAEPNSGVLQRHRWYLSYLDSDTV